MRRIFVECQVFLNFFLKKERRGQKNMQKINLGLNPNFLCLSPLSTRHRWIKFFLHFRHARIYHHHTSSFFFCSVIRRKTIRQRERDREMMTMSGTTSSCSSSSTRTIQRGNTSFNGRKIITLQRKRWNNKNRNKETMIKASSSDQDPSKSMADDTTPNVSVGPSCSIDEPETCSLADLEILYVDALWNYYNDGKFTLSDGQYDRIREELNWQGSGFPTLRRDEIQFVQAAMAYSRGEKIMGDDEYEDLKRKIKNEAGKRKDVTALLLYTKGQQLLDEAQFELMSEEMMKLGIDVGMKGATCTLSQTPTTLENDASAVAKMYAALALVPFLVGLAPTIVFDVLGLHVPNGLALGFATTLAAILTYKLAEYTELNNAQILTGQCPCCEEPFKQLFSGENGGETEMEHKCKVCGTTCSLNREKKLIVTSGPFAI